MLEDAGDCVLATKLHDMLKDVRVVPWRLWRGIVMFMSLNGFHLLLLSQSVVDNKEADFKQKKRKALRAKRSRH